MRQRLLKHIVLLMTLFALAWTPLRAQHLGFGFTQGWTDNPDLDTPFGFNMSLAQSFHPKFDISMDFTLMSHRREYLEDPEGDAGFIEDGVIEHIDSRAQLTSIGFLLLYNPLDWYQFDIMVGGGLSLNILDAQKVGMLTNQTLPVNETTKLALQLQGGLRWRMIMDSPFGAFLNYSLSYLGQSRFQEDVSNPFEDNLNLSQVQLGLLYTF